MLPAEVLMHDRDTKFTVSFDRTLRDGGVQVKRSTYRSPNTCAFVERFIQRPHQGIDNNLPVRKKRRKKSPAESTISTATIACKSRIGGLLKHYYRKAA
jgi:putative transposase